MQVWTNFIFLYVISRLKILLVKTTEMLYFFFKHTPSYLYYWLICNNRNLSGLSEKTTKSFTVSIYLTEYINCNTRWCHFRSVFFVFVSMQDFGILKKAFLNKLLVSHSKEAFENEFQMLLFSNVEVKQVKYSSTMISLRIN